MRILKSSLVMEFIILTFLAITATAFFWTGSRYPELDQKAMMGGDIGFSAIGFDTIVDVPTNASLLWQILGNSINWLYTNWKGMTFGLVIGTLFLTILSRLPKTATKSRWWNSLIGAATGAPMGVCTNCATPIARGLYAGGVSQETALALLASSPTLNIIVLTMSFSLLPFSVAVAKIAMTLTFVLIAVPLLSRLFPQPVGQQTSRGMQKSLEVQGGFGAPERSSQLTADRVELNFLGHLAKDIGRNGWYIIRITVPLMVLAGFLGAALVTVLPLETLVALLPQSGIVPVIASLLITLLVALFLPVPMTFDVIAVAVLSSAGLSLGYAAAMVFALGIFSIYPFMIVWRDISRSLALGCVVALVGIGTIGGAVIHKYALFDEARQDRLAAEMMIISGNATHLRTPIDVVAPGKRADDIEPLITRRDSVAVNIHTPPSVEVSAMDLLPSSDSDGGLFSTAIGSDIGLDSYLLPTHINGLLPFSETRGIASGDVNNDGWVDVVIASDRGMHLYININGRHFVRQVIDIGELDTAWIGTVALADVNNDGWLDLFYSAYLNGASIAMNESGSFHEANVIELPLPVDTVFVRAPAFFDLDRDGRLEIFLGLASFGNTMGEASIDAARNLLLRYGGEEYNATPMPGIPAETLAAAAGDINGDGWPDLIVGNDFAPADIIFLNDGTGQLEQVHREEALVPFVSDSTMSIDIMDIDNDLVPEIFIGQKSWVTGSLTSQPPESQCMNVKPEQARAECVAAREADVAIRDAVASRRYSKCSVLSDDRTTNCAASAFARRNGFVRKQEYCSKLAESWPFLYSVCRFAALPAAKVGPDSLAAELPSVRRQNVLWKRKANGKFEDIAQTVGLMHSGWTWNAKFGDLNNDGWADIYIATGDRMGRIKTPNYLFMSDRGNSFKDVAPENAMDSTLETLSSTYIDFDADGDLDIISVPSDGPVFFHRNNNKNGKSVFFSLDDRVGNRAGIGSTITIHLESGEKQQRMIKASGGHTSFDAPIAHFGVRNTDAMTRVEILWSTGDRSVLDGRLVFNKHYTIKRNPF